MDIKVFFCFIIFGSLCAIISLTICYTLSKTMLIMRDKVRLNTFKIHNTNTPRCGGIGIFIALIVLIIAGIEIPYFSLESVKSAKSQAVDALAGLRFYIACFIIVCSGILKDNEKNSTFVLIVLVQALGISYFIFSFNFLIPSPFLTNLISIFCGAVFLFLMINGMNIIDGINGNATLTFLVIIASLSFVTYHLQINFILFICSLSLGVTLIFLCFNFPYGKMFLGDSGAFLLGFIIGALLFIGVRYYQLNPCYALGILVYPLCEIAASIATRLRYVQSSLLREIILYLFEPNNYHLHFFMYVRYKNYASLIINSIYAICVFFITMYYDNNKMILVITLLFCLIYALLFYIFRIKHQYLYMKT